MEKEFITTIDQMKKEKSKIIAKLNSEKVEESEKINFYKSIIFLDENINKYNNKIKESK